ncbi:MAG: TaqI-like C-terminal specificity domain-containing protein, partial [Candidatus Jacksonbacteria bacterium]
NKNADYGRKLYLIQRCIYGVDIQQIAVEIAKLRFFIALLVDEKIDKKQENWGIEPLPNLDFKIMQGNSLLEELVLGDTSIKLFDADIFAGAKKMKNLFEEDKKADLFGEADKQQAIVQKLNQMHRDYFALSDLEEKDKLKVEIDKIEHDLIEQNVQKELKKLESDNKNLGDYITPGIGMQKEHAVKFQKNLSKQVQIMNVLNDLKNSGVKPFFLWRLNFAEVFENGGFDVVIGNPPYVNIFNIKDENYRNELKNKYKIYKNKTDLYAFFAEKGLDLLKKNGKLVYIFSNSWLGTDSFSKFRELLVNKTKINKLIKCQTKVFEHATVTVVIIILSKEVVNKNEIELLKFTEKEFKKLDFKLSYDFIRRQVAYGFTFDKPLEIKIPFVKLGEIAKFSLGIKTSDNKRFISNSKKSDASYKILRGKDIGRYFKKFNNKWIWYKPDLMNQRKGAGPRKLDCFLRTKILIKDIATEIHATLDTGNYLIVDTINIIYEVKNYDLKFILAILNSKLINKWFKMNFTAGLHIKINQLEHIPIPNKVDQAPFITLVNKILAITKSDDYLQNPAKQTQVREYEKQIDQMVYKLYNLTSEEIEVIEKNE